ncbi:MAG: ATPase, T2SS/T4P/T4SS family [Aquificota bacterium]|nr:ATPase, T2SS/T4P/T4SS family [Aquificota bacterium]
MARKKLGELLEELGFLSREQLEVALEVQKLNGKSLGELLVDLSFVSHQELAQAIAKQAGKEFVDLTLYTPSFEALRLVDKATAVQLEVLPLEVTGNRLLVAVSDPFNVNIADILRRRTGLEPEILVSDRESILRGIEIYYEQLTKPIQERVEEIIKKATRGEADVPRLVDLFLNHAVMDRATDIHISPENTASHVFFRIDGVLHHYYTFPKEIHPSIVSRIKIIGGMDISEQRLPQDGGFTYTFLGESYDVRVSTVPTAYGENVVMRILPKNLSLFNLRSLGFEEDILRDLEEVISKPYGMVLVTGPTGSGKTTTLYAVLRRLNALRRNILTVEDPIEYRFPFIKQTQVNEKAGYTFAVGCQALSQAGPRRDPRG